MTAKEELSQYLDAKGLVEEALEDYQKYKERAEKITAIISDMPKPSGINSDKVGNNASAMADLNQQYVDRFIRAEQKRFFVSERLDAIKNPYRELLRKKYIEDLSLERIACDMGYSYDRMKHMHGEALEVYRKAYNLEKKRED